jgi:hypothetical protein
MDEKMTVTVDSDFGLGSVTMPDPSHHDPFVANKKRDQFGVADAGASDVAPAIFNLFRTPLLSIGQKRGTGR